MKRMMKNSHHPLYVHFLDSLYFKRIPVPLFGGTGFLINSDPATKSVAG